MKYLVTGGGGFLGKAIVKKLIETGNEVHSYSRGSYKELDDLGVKTFNGDISNFNKVKEAMKGCDAVFHVAAKAGVWGKYNEYFQTNVKGTENVLDACKELGISRLVYTSSPSVVFDGSDQEGLNERTPFPKSYLAHYPSTKAMAEQMVLRSDTAELSTVALRPHLIWGPGDNHLVPRVLKMGKLKRLRFIGKKDKLVDSVYIDNAVDAHIIAMEKLCDSNADAIKGKAFFVTNQDPVPLSELINGILKAGKIPTVKKRIPAVVAYAIGGILESIYEITKMKGEPPMTRFVAKQLSTAHWYDSSASKNDLGYQAQVSIKDGLNRLEKHLRNN